MNDLIDRESEDTNPMAHQEALAMNAVELYLMNDMPADQRLRFEQHYFECTECAQAVAAGQHFVHGITPIPAAEPWWRRLAIPVLVPLNAALLALLTVQNFSTIPALRNQLTSFQPNTVITAHPLQMGSDQGEIVKTDSLTLEFVLPPNAASPFYRVNISREGKELFYRVVPAPVGSRLSFHISKQAISPGSFNVTVFGLASQESSDGTKLEQYYFNIQ